LKVAAGLVEASQNLRSAQSVIGIEDAFIARPRPMNPYALWAWPWTSSIEVYQRLLDSLGEASGAADAARDAAPGEIQIEWLTPSSVRLDLDMVRLRQFSEPKEAEPPLLIAAPYSLHDGGFLDLAPGHSLVQTLKSNGCDRVFLVEWKPATPAMRDYGVDSQLALLNVAIDEIGQPVDLVGLCQGGWLSLVYAARFPKKVRKLVLAAAPIDTQAAPSALAAPGKPLNDAIVDSLLRLGDGLALGRHISKLWTRETDKTARLIAALQLSGPPATQSEQELVEKFNRWDHRLLDLPGVYYRQIAEWLYEENRLVAGTFPALGRAVDLSALRCPLFLLAGAEDVIVPPAQLFELVSHVAADLEIETALAPCSHLALFMGRRTLSEEWPRIAQWLAK
jgi:poly[(R)-3-hydroxyalkanoate] polymerase subunit PhaC